MAQQRDFLCLHNIYEHTKTTVEQQNKPNKNGCRTTCAVSVANLEEYSSPETEDLCDGLRDSATFGLSNSAGHNKKSC